MLGRFIRCTSMISIALLAQATMASQFGTEGQFSVGANGAARYVLPIKVPTGVAGMEPHLSIVYDSSAGNGYFGAGMDLTGFSRIERCKKTAAQDGAIKGVTFTQDDAYCLDGARLIPISGVNGADGTEYRTELDGFSKIVSVGKYSLPTPRWDPLAGQYIWTVGGPVSFMVYTKSGQTLAYGTSGDSQIKPGDDSMVNSGGYFKVIEGWALRKVSDRAGNYMIYTYTNISSANKSNPGSVPDDGNFRPVRIDYTGNAAAGLATSNYVLLDSPGVLATTPIQYEGGYVVPRSGLGGYIGQIKTYSGKTANNGGQDFTSYNVNADYNYGVVGNTGWQYSRGPFRAASIEECFRYYCLQPITFGWEGVNVGFQFKTSAFPGARTDYQHFFVDVNGTGKKSWIQISQAYDDAWVGAVNPDGTFTSASWTKFPQSVGSLNNYAHYFADVNGDGKMDWIRVSRTTNEAWVALGTGNGGFTFWSKYTQSPGAANTNRHYFVDVDGDGRADWAQVAAVNGALQISYARSNGDGTFQFCGRT